MGFALQRVSVPHLQHLKSFSYFNFSCPASSSIRFLCSSSTPVPLVAILREKLWLHKIWNFGCDIRMLNLTYNKDDTTVKHYFGFYAYFFL